MHVQSKLISITRAQSPAAMALFVVLALFSFFSDNIFYIEVIQLAAIYAIFAMSWDILTGYTHEVNFGFAFFVGGAGYLSGILNSFLSFSPFLAIPLAAAAAGVTGIIIGYLTLRLNGPYFSMATMAFASILFKLSFVFYQITGGEEGISSLDPLTESVKSGVFVVLAVTLCVYFLLTLYARSKRGTILKAIRASEDAAKSSGINTAYYKIEAFAISGFMAGIGGGVFAHSQMAIGPTMLSGYISIIVVLIAVIGGMGTIAGPLISAIILSIVNEYLRIVEEYRIVIYTGLLIVLIYAAPEGLLNLKIIKRSRLISYIFLGSRNST